MIIDCSPPVGLDGKPNDGISTSKPIRINRPIAQIGENGTNILLHCSLLILLASNQTPKRPRNNTHFKFEEFL